ncbi:hypothetical protein NP511_22445 (plasmid) [Natrinema thermotolerans]|uniref:Uncharacterized protein n=1 Tax=Natrinema thermotolerans TaxID=121872 RepID=A0AAF0PJB9_9EURY|nr:hypothetical protein [Natrinema thermotolerans]WMT10265.1 hypothetical protein NP511_22445 [Natrinema thermotolerans]
MKVSLFKIDFAVVFFDALLAAGVLLAIILLGTSLLDTWCAKTRGVVAVALGGLLTGLFAAQNEWMKAMLSLFVTVTIIISLRQRI